MTLDVPSSGRASSELRGAPASPQSMAAGRRLTTLDGIRALAVIVVLLYHGSVLSGGYLGVDVFFVLSGFLITVLLTEEQARTGRISVPRFWFRRAFRLLPALVGYLLAGLLAVILLKPPQDRAQFEVDALTSLLGVNNWWRVIGGEQAHGAWDGHLWSLAVEAQFYLVWPVILLGVLALPRRSQWLSLGALITAVFGWRLVLALGLLGPNAADRTYYGTDTRADALLIGALLALLWRSGVLAKVSAAVWLWASSLAWFCLAVAVGFAPTLSTEPSWLNYGGFTLIGVLAALAVAGTVMAPGRGMDRLLDWRPVAWLGGISYALYLWHFPVTIMLADQFGEQVGHLAPALAALVVTAGLAWLSGVLLERPVMARRKVAEARVFGPCDN